MTQQRQVIKFRLLVAFALFLTIVLFMIYARIGNFGVLHNDDIYLVNYYSNIIQFSGKRALQSLFFTPDFYVYYSPIANLAYFFDIVVFGPKIGWYRYTHVLLHILSSLFLFTFLCFSTKAPWKSFFAASLFAVHPLNSESIATLYARTNPLSGFFSIAGLLFYFFYADKPSIRRYLPVLLLFMLALLAKPSMLIFVFILLLIDYWPLERIFIGKDSGDGGGLSPIKRCHKRNRLVLIEKIPFIMISLAWYFFTSWYYRQSQFPALVANIDDHLNLTVKLVFLPISCVAYVWKTIFPTGLPSYASPLFSGDLPLWRCFGAMALLVLITILVLCFSRKRKYLVTGWFWFLAVLGPHLPIVVSQKNLVIERYAYISLIGLFILIAWGGADLFQHLKLKKHLIAAIAGLSLLILALTTWHQTGHRKDALSFYEHAVAVFPGSSEAHSRLGELLINDGRADEAVYHFSRAVQLDPENPNPHSHLGDFFAAADQPDKAVFHYQQALRVKPDYAAVHNNFANLLVELGNPEAAITHYQAALKIQPLAYEVYNNLATVLINKGEFDKARGYLEKALVIKPDYQTAKENLRRLKAIKGGFVPSA